MYSYEICDTVHLYPFLLWIFTLSCYHKQYNRINRSKAYCNFYPFKLLKRHTIWAHTCSYAHAFLPLSMFTPLSVRCFWQLSQLVHSAHPQAPHISTSIAVRVLWEGLGLCSCLTQLNLCDGACRPQSWLWQIALFKSAATNLSEYKS